MYTTINEFKIYESNTNPFKVVARDRLHLIKLINANIDNFGPTVDLNYIDTSQVTSMCWAFQHSDFNGDISEWDVSNVTDMQAMFYQSKFNGNIENWDVSNVENMFNMFVGTILEENNHLPSWYDKNKR